MTFLGALPMPLLIAAIVVLVVVGYLFANTLRRIARLVMAIAAVLMFLFLMGGW